MVCVELPGISNYLRGEYRSSDLGQESRVQELSRVYRYNDAASGVWHVLQERSCSPHVARSRRRDGGGPEVRTSPDERRGRCAAVSRSPRRRRPPPPSARGATGRRAARRRRLGTRRTHGLERVSGTAGDERPGRWPPPRPTTSSTKVRALLYLSCRVSPRAARRSTTRSRRSIRGPRDRSLPTSSFFFPRSRTSRPTVTTTRQRKGRSERAPARDAAAPMTRRRCPSRARPVTTRRRLVPTRRRREGFQSESGISSPRRSENDFLTRATRFRLLLHRDTAH